MKLNNNLYHIIEKQVTPEGVSFRLCLHAHCVIYQAHFPGEPITPGVCIIQMAEELLSEHLQATYELSKMKTVRFHNVLSPDQTTEVMYDLRKISVDADLHQATVTVDVHNEEQSFASMIMTCNESI